MRRNPIESMLASWVKNLENKISKKEEGEEQEEEEARKAVSRGIELIDKMQEEYRVYSLELEQMESTMFI